MKVMITGGLGFVGSHLCDELLKNTRHELVILSKSLAKKHNISLQEAQSSTAIENIFTTEDELYKAVSDTIKEDSANAATKEVLRYREALWSGYNALVKNKAFDKTIAIKIFQQIKSTKQGIRPPQSQVVIKRGQSEFKPGEIVYTPPRGAGLVEKKMDNLFDFLNAKNEFDPLLRWTQLQHSIALFQCYQPNKSQSHISASNFFMS